MVKEECVKCSDSTAQRVSKFNINVRGFVIHEIDTRKIIN